MMALFDMDLFDFCSIFVISAMTIRAQRGILKYLKMYVQYNFYNFFRRRLHYVSIHVTFGSFFKLK